MKGHFKQSIIALRWPLIVLVLALLTGAAMVIASLYLQDTRAHEYLQVQNRLRAAQLALNNARREESDLQTYRSRYDSLFAKGVFGQERRLNWVEYVDDLAKLGRFQSLTYEIATQKPVSLGASGQANSVDMLASRIQLKMGFVHEGDMARTLDELHQSNTGLYRIDACSVARKDAAQEPTVGENITAACRLQWITLRPRAGKG